MSRRSWMITAAAVLTGALLSAPAAHSEPAETLPDLGMARLSDLVVATTADGQQQLRFSATIVNVGSGAFELSASRPDTASSWTVSQRVFRSDGTSSLTPTSAELAFGGDGHGHWHVRDLEVYVLERLDNGAKVGTATKGGFCFFDTDPYRLDLPGAPGGPVYDGTDCGEEDSLEAFMGLSVGWGDTYAWTLPDQYIDITGLDNGKYRLHATADPHGMFTESEYTNNGTWVDIRLSNRKGQTSLNVLGYGPTADQPATDDSPGNGNGNGNGNNGRGNNAAR